MQNIRSNDRFYHENLCAPEQCVAHLYAMPLLLIPIFLRLDVHIHSFHSGPFAKSSSVHRNCVHCDCITYTLGCLANSFCACSLHSAYHEYSKRKGRTRLFQKAHWTCSRARFLHSLLCRFSCTAIPRVLSGREVASA